MKVEGKFKVRNPRLVTAAHSQVANRILRRIGWLSCLALVMVLVVGGITSARDVLGQAQGVRGVLRAGADLSEDEVNNPFVCLRAGGEAALAREALAKLGDGYLRGVALCMAGEEGEGLKALEGAGASAQVQYAGGLSSMDAEAGVELLAEMGLSDPMLVAIVEDLIAQPEIEPYPALQVLAEQASEQAKTWHLWLQGYSKLEKAGDWQAARDWVVEGLRTAPSEAHGSLYMRLGRSSLMASDPRNYEAALSFYNHALERGGWIFASDEAYAHLYRGEVYRALKDEYGPELALLEYETVLSLQPNSYWAYIDIGFVHLYDFKNLELAEEYFRQALAANDQSPHAYLYMGDVYRARGDQDAAANWYRQALERQPGWQAALERLKAEEGE